MQCAAFNIYRAMWVLGQLASKSVFLTWVSVFVFQSQWNFPKLLDWLFPVEPILKFLDLRKLVLIQLYSFQPRKDQLNMLAESAVGFLELITLCWLDWKLQQHRKVNRNSFLPPLFSFHILTQQHVAHGWLTAQSNPTTSFGQTP